MMEQIQQLLLILISSALVSNVVLSQFLGLCPFLGVSKKVETAAGMGTAVIFVITLSSGVAGAIYKFILTPLNIQYLQTEGVRHLYRHGEWLCDGAWFHDFHCHSCGHP